MTGDTALPLRGVINLSLSAAEYLHPNPLFGCHPLTAPLAAAFGTDFALILQQMQTGKKTSFIKSINGLKLQHSTQNTPKNEAEEGSRRRGRGGGGGIMTMLNADLMSTLMTLPPVAADAA